MWMAQFYEKNERLITISNRLIRFAKKMRRGKYLKVIVGGLIFVALVITGVFAPYICPHDPLEQHLEKYLRRPILTGDGSRKNILGTDNLGRDLLSRIIYGARVSQSGTVLDPAGFSISANEYTQWYSSVAFGTANYLVIWEERRSSSSSDIYGTRVNQAGIVLDPEGIAISPATDYQRYPSVAFNGTNYLVVWQDYQSGSLYDIYGARVNLQGYGSGVYTAGYGGLFDGRLL